MTVFSGVPHRSTICPALYLLYINYISEELISTRRLFAVHIELDR